MQSVILNSLRSILSIFRLQHWANTKIPLLIGSMCSMCVIGNIVSDHATVIILVTVLFSSLFLSFGYFVNDLADRRSDALSGKYRESWRISFPVAIILSIFLLALGSMLLTILGGSNVVVYISLFGYMLALFYSSPPVRFKTRSFSGPIVAAFAQWVFPFIALCFASQLIGPSFFLMAFALFILGIRWIMVHQIRDIKADNKAHVMTLVTRIGETKIKTFVRNIIFPLELLTWSICFASLSISTPIFLMVFGAFGIAVFSYFLCQKKEISDDDIWQRPMAKFYFIYFPIFSALLLFYRTRSIELVLTIVLVLLLTQSNLLNSIVNSQNA